jgi:hypothetical protein
MKKFITLTLALACTFSFKAQQEAPPQGINYQAVAIDNSGKEIVGIDISATPVSNKEIRVRFSIIKSSANGQLTYREQHLVTTDAYGLFNTVIGQGIPDASPMAFSQIDWGTGYHFLKVEIDIKGGTDYIDMGTQQLWSVPYALYSKYADQAGNGIESVADNGDGSLTFTYLDGSTYTTSPLTGLTGPQGPQGEQGPQGVAGANGQDGVSAYEIWLAEGNTGTEADFLADITGSQGIQGEQGPIGLTGPQGEQGPIGLTGATGPQGEQGPIGLTGPQGPQGPIGLTGPQGPIGLTGPTGATGPQGPIGLTGPQGSQGEQGPIGLTGPAGDTGPQGPIGLTGATGATGPQGPIGLTGPQGPIGLTGPTGATGPQGEQGPIGLTGATGPQGIQGEQGSIGLTGPQGEQGPIGLTGPQGPQGEQGPIGLTGPQGPQGDQGPIGLTGAQGLQGEQGPAGVNGLSAYQVAVNNGFIGTEAQWLSSLQGEPSSLQTYSIGQFAHGGIVFWVDPTGMHGLVVSLLDASSVPLKWQDPGWQGGVFYLWTNSTADGLYGGKTNTMMANVVHRIGNYTPESPMSSSRKFNSQNYSDWYLPSKYELNLLYQQIGVVDGQILSSGGTSLSGGVFWSSTEQSGDLAFWQNFNTGQTDFGWPYSKNSALRVRPVRAF